jgi:hypothetical protein
MLLNVVDLLKGVYMLRLYHTSIISFMESFDLNNINPRFKLGATSREFCDCIGLVILYLRDQDFECNWERFVKREITKWEDFNSQMLDNGFLTDGVSLPSTDYKFIVWREEDGTGHIGVVFKGFIYQMTPYGIQISSEIPASKRPTYWYY